jgi:hypothetical protein
MEIIDTLTGAMESVIGEVRQKFKDSSKDAGIIDSLRAFAAAVDWKVRHTEWHAYFGRFSVQYVVNVAL